MLSCPPSAASCRPSCPSYHRRAACDRSCPCGSSCWGCRRRSHRRSRRKTRSPVEVTGGGEGGGSGAGTKGRQELSPPLLDAVAVAGQAVLAPSPRPLCHSHPQQPLTSLTHRLAVPVVSGAGVQCVGGQVNVAVGAGGARVHHLDLDAAGATAHLHALAAVAVTVKLAHRQGSVELLPVEGWVGVGVGSGGCAG